MFNLLPQEEQRLLDREYRLRLAATGLFFFAALSVIASIFMLPSLTLLSGKESLALKSRDSLKKEVALMSSDDRGVLAIAAKKVAALSAKTPTLSFHELITDITGARMAGVKITGLSIKRGDKDSFDAVISGIAADRDTLLSFARNLQNNKIFSTVTVPVSNFAPASDINFSISAKTK